MTRKPSPDDVYNAVRSLLDAMPPATRRRAETLLQEAQNGKKTDNALLRLLKDNETLRSQLERMLYGGEAVGERSYAPLPGNAAEIPASQMWVCPHADCSESESVIQEGEDPPYCPIHNVPMIRADQKKG
jgi:hypothetical protein